MSVRTDDFAHAGLEQPPSPPARDGPRRLTDPREDPRVRARREADLEIARDAERRRLTRLRYSVAALIVVDVIAGTWIYLHAPRALPSFSLANFAVFGISGVLRLLPPEEREALKKRFLDWTRKRLSAEAAPRSLALFVAAMLGVALFWSSVHVQGSAGATAELRLVQGSEFDLDTVATRRADTIRLAQSGGEVIERRLIPPLGQQLWAYTATHVSRGDRIALPWRPVRWAYPDDFDEQVTIFVLPMPRAAGILRVNKPKFVLRDLVGREIIRSSMTDSGVRVQFSDRDVDVSALAPAWIAEYRRLLVPVDSFALGADSVLVIGLLAPHDTVRRAEALRRHDDAVARLGDITERVQAWRGGARVTPTRPLHLGEKVRYVFDYDGTNAGAVDLVLDRNPYFLFVQGEAVAKPDAPTNP
jgi:hypothetical protein